MERAVYEDVYYMLSRVCAAAVLVLLVMAGAKAYSDLKVGQPPDKEGPAEDSHPRRRYRVPEKEELPAQTVFELLTSEVSSNEWQRARNPQRLPQPAVKIIKTNEELPQCDRADTICICPIPEPKEPEKLT